jgi:chitinase
VTRPCVIAYYPGPKGKAGYPAENLPAELLTHVNYSFLVLEEYAAEGGERLYRAIPDDQEAADLAFPVLRDLKARHPHLKVLLSVGGWGQSSTAFSEASATPERCEAFVRSLVAHLDEQGFDGIDVDWEYPVHGGAESLPPPEGLAYHRPEDRERFTALLRELRRQLGAERLLTIATPAPPDLSAHYDLAAAAPLVELVNVMTYDLHNGWETRGPANFHTSLYPAAGDPSPSELARSSYNADAAIREHLRFLPPEKVVLGAAFYGRGWQGVPRGGQDGLFQPAESLYGTPTYREIKRDLEPVGAKHRHPETRSCWVYRVTDEAAGSGVWVGYDDPQGMLERGRYAREHGLAGVMFWEVTGDDEEHSLLRGLREGLGLSR